MAPTDLTLNTGLSLFDCADHYAVLGVPIDSEPSVIRKRYIRIARLLHPDSCGPGMDKELANSILSKLVNPAYEFLCQTKQLDEYAILLRLVGQRYQNAQSKRLRYESAQALCSDNINYEEQYQNAVQTVSAKQFSTLAQYIQFTEEISELNLVYLMRREGQGNTAPSSSRSQAQTAPPPQHVSASGGPRRPQTQAPNQATNQAHTRTTNQAHTQTTNQANTQATSRVPVRPPTQPISAPQPLKEEPSEINHSLVDQYYRRAQELVSRQCYPEAIRELKEILEGNNPIDPSNSRALTLLGVIYQKHLKSPAMARMYFTKALKSAPDNQEAKEGLEAVNQSRSKKPQNQPKTPEKARFNFFGLFSGKK